MALLLFDIDGTLINTHGSGRDAANISFEKQFGCKDAFNSIPLMGRTDRYIWKAACRNCGISLHTFNKKKHILLRDYYDLLKKELSRSSRATICPGIDKILAKVSRGHHLGLLTGNFKKSGIIKIAHFGLDKYFPIGGFGNDNENRNHIARLTIRRARRYYKKNFKNHEIFIIGDTPFDIECARTTGTVSIAVATGTFKVAELKKYSPDHLFDSFKNHEDFLKIISN
ncbi:MAG: HAD hydrolase-like protein [Spirochaetes bacterium]|nr:HAD hydrolase-like protein [Spirochaetota bacterium]